MPAYVVTTQPLKAISYDAIDAAKMLTTLTLAGVTGSVNLTNLAAGTLSLESAAVKAELEHLLVSAANRGVCVLAKTTANAPDLLTVEGACAASDR